LSAIIGALMAVSLCLAGTWLTIALRVRLTQEIDRQLQTTLATLSAPARLDAVISGPSDYVLMVFGRDGAISWVAVPRDEDRSALPALESFTTQQATDLAGDAFTVNAASGGGVWRAVARVGSPGAAVVLALPFDSVLATTRAMTMMVVWMTVAAVILATATGYFMVQRSLRPLRSVEAAAANIAAGDLSTRIPPAQPGTEVGQLTESLNAMLAQIEVAFATRRASEARMRSFVSDASHELRTPLAAIRGYAELYRIGGLADASALSAAMLRVEAEATRMGLLVSDLLTLARLDESRPLARRDVDLLVIAGDALADAAAIAPDRPLALVGIQDTLGPVADPDRLGHMGPPGQAPVVVGDEAALRRVATNLMANALQHTPPTSPIELAVGSIPGGPAVLEVRDHGPGIPPDKRDKVFDRFFRLDGSRSRDSGGTGLGLAIVAGLVAAHGGVVQVDETAGGGATFRVLLPAGAPAVERPWPHPEADAAPPPGQGILLPQA
jgi:two-component system OmpR family sensor kinase